MSTIRACSAFLSSIEIARSPRRGNGHEKNAPTPTMRRPIREISISTAPQRDRTVVVSRVVDAFDKNATGVSTLQHSHNIVRLALARCARAARGRGHTRPGSLALPTFSQTAGPRDSAPPCPSSTSPTARPARNRQRNRSSSGWGGSLSASLNRPMLSRVGLSPLQRLVAVDRTPDRSISLTAYSCGGAGPDHVQT